MLIQPAMMMRAQLVDQTTHRGGALDHASDMKIQRPTPRRAVHQLTPRTTARPSSQPRAPGGLSPAQPASQHEASNPTRRALLATSAVVIAAAAQPRASAADTHPTINTVFVAGATGQTGSRVVAELRRRGYTVIAGVRSPAKATALGFDSVCPYF